MRRVFSMPLAWSFLTLTLVSLLPKIFFSEPGTPCNWLLASPWIICGHLDQGKDFLVELFWYARSVHLQVKETLRHFVSAQEILVTTPIITDPRILLLLFRLQWLALWFFWFRWLQNDSLMLREASNLEHTEICKFLCLFFKALILRALSIRGRIITAYIIVILQILLM